MLVGKACSCGRSTQCQNRNRGTQGREEKGKEGVAEEGERGAVRSAVLAGTHEPVELQKPQMAAGIDAAVVNAVARPLKRHRERISAGGAGDTGTAAWDAKSRERRASGVWLASAPSRPSPSPCPGLGRAGRP